MIDIAKREFQTAEGEACIAWQPDMERIERVVLKNARGHAYFEYGERKMGAPRQFWARPLESISCIGGVLAAFVWFDTGC